MVAYYSFAGIAFGPRISDSVPLVQPGEMQGTARHIPGSNYNVRDQGGVTGRTYAAQVRLLPADVAAFESAYQGGVSAPLVIAGINWPAATMTKLSGHSMTPGGEYHFYDAEWSLVDNVLGVLSP